MKYLVVIEKGRRGWGAHVPDLPGCIAAGKTRTEVVKLITEAIEFHIEGLKEAGQKVPSPHSEVRLVDVTAASRRCSRRATPAAERQRSADRR